GTKYDRPIDAAGFFRVPSPAQTPAASRLFLGHHYRPVLRPLLDKIQGGGVRRACPEVVEDAVPNLIFTQFRLDQAGYEDVRHLQKLIAGGVMALDLHAHLPQLPDPAPHRGTRYPDFGG